jgi:hypothetical protein
MSFQAYLDNIQTKTGKSPDQFRAWGEEKGYSTGTGLSDGVKVGTIVSALKEEFGLGHGHAMAIVAVLKRSKIGGEVQ